MDPIRSGGADQLSFRRILDIPFDACMAALESWRLTGHDGELHLGKSFLRGPVERDLHCGSSRIEVRLARGPGRRPVRMRLDIDPWSSARTVLELIPDQRVRPSTAYFRAGHRLLDSLIYALPTHVPVRQHASGRIPSLAGSRLWPALQLAPAAGPVVGDDLPEHGAEGRRVDDLALTDGHGAGGLVVVAGGDDPLGIGDDAAVVEEDVHVVPGREQRADVALEHEIRLPAPLDGLGHLRVGGVHEVADLAADGLLPVRQGVDVGVNALVSGVRQG
jgi:hypothetical protein